jgi:hypothetical protein
MAECPSIDELADLVNAGDVATERHVAACRRCRALLRLFDQRERVTANELSARELPPASLPDRAPPEGDLRFGEVCVIDADVSDGTLMVAVVLARADGPLETLEVAPISTEVANANEWDLLLTPEDGPLGYSAMAELWNHGTVLTDQVVERFGLLAVDGQQRLNALYDALLSEGEPSTDVPRGLPVVVDADPRAIFQEEEAERARPFWHPAARVFAEKARDAVPSVGALLGNWLEQQGYDAPAFAGEIGWPTQDVVLVGADEFDPKTFSSDRLADLFRRTDIPSDDIEAGLWQTIQPCHFAFGTTAIEERAAYRRTARRRGVERGGWAPRGAAEVALPPEERERRRKQYINDVLEALEEKRGF